MVWSSCPLNKLFDELSVWYCFLYLDTWLLSDCKLLSSPPATTIRQLSILTGQIFLLDMPPCSLVGECKNTNNDQTKRRNKLGLSCTKLRTSLVRLCSIWLNIFFYVSHNWRTFKMSQLFDPPFLKVEKSSSPVLSWKCRSLPELEWFQLWVGFPHGWLP